MKNPNSYFEQSMDDIVFEERNKKYGAYQLRKNINRFLTTALSVALLFTCGFSAFSLTHKVDKPEPVKTVVVDPTNIIVNVPDKPKVILPAPPAAPAPLKATTEFVTMVVKQDTKVDNSDNPPKIEDLGDKQIGLKTIEAPVGEPTVLTPQTPVTVDPPIEDHKVWLAVEQPPEYKDGFASMYAWLANYIKYPKQARDQGIEGTVYVQFIVSETGKITDVTVARGIGFGCDEEAVKAVKNMADWKPGKQQGVPVKVKYTLPITFKLHN